MTQKHSSESLPQHRVPFQTSQSREMGQQNQVPYQTSQLERPGPLPAQQSYNNSPVHPVQSQITEKMPPNPAQDKHGQQPYLNQGSEGQYLSQAPSGPQHITRTGSGGQNKSPYAPQQQQQQQQQQQHQQQQQQQQQWQQQYRPRSPPQYGQYHQTNKAVQDPGASRPGVYPSTSSHSIPSGFPHPTSKPEGYLSPQGSRTDLSVTSTYPQSTTSHTFTQEDRPSQKDDLPPKPGVGSMQSSQPTAFPQSGQQGGPTPDISHSRVTTTPPSQDVQPNMAYPQSMSSHNLPQHHTHQHPSDIKNSNPSHDTKGPYFPAVSSQASQLYSTESQPKNDSSSPSINPKLRSNSFQDFNPTKVVLAKPGALSMGPLSGYPSAITSSHDLASVSTPGTQTVKESNTSNIGMIYSEVAPLETTVNSGIGDPSGQTTGIHQTASLSGVKPKSSIDDKLMENLKSLDSPNALASKQSGKSTKDENIGTEIVGANDQESGSNVQGSGESHKPGLGSQGLASGQEDVHKLQQKVLLQQQQLIEQQQRFLEQQALGENSQVRKLMEQIKQQQKELDELRSEVKGKEQLGEIERHLELLERRQIAIESKKTDEVVSDETGTGRLKVQIESGEKAVLQETQARDMASVQNVSEVNTGPTTSDLGESLLKRTTQDQLSEITGGVEISKQEINDYFLMSQLSEFSSTSSQHDDKVTVNSTPTDNSASEQKRHVSQSSTISDEPPPKPSRTPQARPNITTSEKSETHPTSGSSIPPTTDILGPEIMSDVGPSPPTTNKQAVPPTPMKYRPPPAIPEPYTPSPPAQLTRDVFSKPASDAVRVDPEKPADKEDYISRLADLVMDYRETVNNLTKRQTREPNILTKEWLVRYRLWYFRHML